MIRQLPRVLCNSFPKSGTHLLVGLVSGLTGLRVSGRKAYWHHVYRARIDREVPTLGGEIRKLEACESGEVYRGHLEADAGIAACLQSRRFKHVFIYRDPRDAITSLLYWWKRYEAIDTWPFRYFRFLKSDEERLHFLIEGWPEEPADPRFPVHVDYPDVAARFARFRPWLADPSCLSIRFEDLVDPLSKEDTCRRIAQYILPEIEAAEIDGIVRRMFNGGDPRHSRTFRQGRPGDWRNVFSDDHRRFMKVHAGRLLIELGYEN